MMGTKINSLSALFTLHIQHELTASVNIHFMPSGLRSASQKRTTTKKKNEKMKMFLLEMFWFNDSIIHNSCSHLAQAVVQNKLI